MDEAYSTYNLIVNSVDAQTYELCPVKRNKAQKLTQQTYEQRKKVDPKTKLSDCEIDYRSIDKDDEAFRVMTFEHIRDEPAEKRIPNSC